MIIRKVDSTNDWTFGKGLSNYATDELAIEENINSRILSWVGDCFWALDDGVDWKNRLEAGQKENLLNEIKALILQSYGVVGVNSVTGEFNGSSRMFTIRYDINTIYSSNFQAEISQGTEV